MDILDATYFAVALLTAQILLGIVLFAVFIRMRIEERDTRLVEEEGRMPILEVTGAGRIGRGRWSFRPLCRLTLYDEFLVAAVRAQRTLVHYADIESVAMEDRKKVKVIRILGPIKDGRPTPDIHFAPKDPEAIEVALNQQLSNMRD